MNNGISQQEFERDLQKTWSRLISQDLPNAARARNWPVSTPDGFERLLLDHVQDDGRITHDTALPRNASAIDLLFAIEMGSKLLDGEACISTINQYSLAKRAAPHADD